MDQNQTEAPWITLKPIFQQMHADADKPFNINAVRAAVDFINFEFAKLDRENASAGSSFISNSWQNAIADVTRGLDPQTPVAIALARAIAIAKDGK